MVETIGTREQRSKLFPSPNKQAAITIKNRKPNRNRGFEKTETENRTDWKKADQKTENRNRPKKPKPTQH